MDFPGGSVVKNLPANARDTDSIAGSGKSPGEGNGNHSSILPWRIPCTKEPGRLQSMESQSDTTERLSTYSLRSGTRHSFLCGLSKVGGQAWTETWASRTMALSYEYSTDVFHSHVEVRVRIWASYRENIRGLMAVFGLSVPWASGL